MLPSVRDFGVARLTESKRQVLITGGAGYIGSTIASAFIDDSVEPIILDNFSSGPKAFVKDRIFFEGDVGDVNLIHQIFKRHQNIEAVIHCAAKIIVPESVERPDIYYHENVVKSLSLFNALKSYPNTKIVFSSSAAIYGETDSSFMVRESSPIKPSSPYAHSKFMMEQMLSDYCRAFGMKAIALRYFNPIGADPELRTGAYVKSPTHVLGRLISTSEGKQPYFEMTGVDWPTRDGTGIRDYIHVWDLAKAHVLAVKHFTTALSQSQHGQDTGFIPINLGTGHGVTVRELVTAFENVTKKPLSVKESPRRPGDVAGSFANADTAQNLIHWKAELSIEEGIQSALKWKAKLRDLKIS
jgi:UDP-glucose 4-epimerase